MSKLKLVGCIAYIAASSFTVPSKVMAQDEIVPIDNIQGAEVGWLCGFNEECSADVRQVYTRYGVDRLLAGDKGIVLRPAPGGGICALIPVCAEDLINKGDDHNFSEVLSIEIDEGLLP